MVMPSEESLGRSFIPKSDAGVTQPFMTQVYRCIAAYETKDTKNRPFKVEVGEAVDVLIKDKAGERNYIASCLIFHSLFTCLYAFM